MPNQDVIITMSAKDAELVRAWQRAKQGIKETGQELDKLRVKGKSLDQSMGAMLAGQLAKWGSIAAAIRLATNALTALADAQARVRRGEAQTTFPLEEQFRDFQLQSGQKNDRRKQIEDRSFEIAHREAIEDPGTVAKLGKELASSGFNFDEVLRSGGALEEMARIVASAGSEGRNLDPGDFTQSFVKFLMGHIPRDAQGKMIDPEKYLTAAKVREVGQAAMSLWRGGNLKIADLQEAATIAPVMHSAHLDEVEHLALTTALKDTLPGEEATVGLRNVIGRMQTAAAHPDKVEALAKIGLKAEDIDIVGEDFATALKRLRDAIMNAPENIQNIVLTKLFDERGRNTGATLLANTDRVVHFIDVARDTSGFEQQHQTATEGEAAAKRRTHVAEQRNLYGGQGARDELVKSALRGQVGGWRGEIAATAYAPIRWATDLLPDLMGFSEREVIQLALFGGSAASAEAIEETVASAQSPDRDGSAAPSDAFARRGPGRAPRGAALGASVADYLLRLGKPQPQAPAGLGARDIYGADKATPRGAALGGAVADYVVLRSSVDKSAPRGADLGGRAAAYLLRLLRLDGAAPSPAPKPRQPPRPAAPPPRPAAPPPIKPPSVQPPPPRERAELPPAPSVAATEPPPRERVKLPPPRVASTEPPPRERVELPPQPRVAAAEPPPRERVELPPPPRVAAAELPPARPRVEPVAAVAPPRIDLASLSAPVWRPTVDAAAPASSGAEAATRGLAFRDQEYTREGLRETNRLLRQLVAQTREPNVTVKNLPRDPRSRRDLSEPAIA